MPTYYPHTVFSYAAGNYVDYYPKVLALPHEGLAEYVALADCYNKITSTLLDIIEHLKEFKAIDPIQTDRYNDMIEESLHKAHLNMMEWELQRHRILTKWPNQFFP